VSDGLIVHQPSGRSVRSPCRYSVDIVRFNGAYRQRALHTGRQFRRLLYIYRITVCCMASTWSRSAVHCLCAVTWCIQKCDSITILRMTTRHYVHTKRVGSFRHLGAS